MHFVAVLNLTRFAREQSDHCVRSHLPSLGLSLRSATEPTDDISTGKLMEGVQVDDRLDDVGDTSSV
jgi:hypothetical protein